MQTKRRSLSLGQRTWREGERRAIVPIADLNHCGAIVPIARLNNWDNCSTLGTIETIGLHFADRNGAGQSW